MNTRPASGHPFAAISDSQNVTIRGGRNLYKMHFPRSEHLTEGDRVTTVSGISLKWPCVKLRPLSVVFERAKGSTWPTNGRYEVFFARYVVV